ncbi:MAG: dephospho-CoA kinase [Gammaproteobacteria bacterium]
MNRRTAAVLRIGLTGGIASGKSTVADCFAELGIPVIDTDVIARELVMPGEPALEELVQTFGADILQTDGSLDRQVLRTRVFADPAQRHRLESILHPKIRARTLSQAEVAGGPYQVIVVPLLLETGFDALVDEIVVVDCPESEQRQRLQARDGEDSTQVERMLAAQISRAARLGRADAVIDNSGTLDATRQQVAALHHRLLDQTAKIRN